MNEIDKLQELDDVSLLQRLNTYKENLPADFWKNRFSKKYGEKFLQYKPTEINWKDYYLKTVLDLEKFKKHPLEFLDCIVWKQDINNSFYIDWKNKTLTPLLIAPEWVMNNLRLLNLENVQIDDILYENITPCELLSILQPQENKFIISLHPKYFSGPKYPLYMDLENVKKELYKF